MHARVFNSETGTIEDSPISDPTIAKDLGRCLVEMPSSGVYRVQLIDPMRGDLVLFDTYDDAKALA